MIQPIDIAQWVFVVKIADKPGTLTAAAAVFSNRGISLEGILGSGIGSTAVGDGRLVLSFRATADKQALLYRTLVRLPDVFHVDVYAHNDPQLRVIAIAKLDLNAKVPKDDDDYSIETLAQTAHERVVMLNGSPATLEGVIAQFRQQDQLRDIVMSYIAV